MKTMRTPVEDTEFWRVAPDDQADDAVDEDDDEFDDEEEEDEDADEPDEGTETT